MAAQQFLSLEKRGAETKLQLDEDVVHKLLLSDNVADNPVIVVCVAGAFRTGKSFLLNSIVRYLTASDKSRWLENKSESFRWESGCNAHTKGMFMSPPIPIPLQSGEEATLLLIDTQGIFDENSTTADSTRVFSLSTLFSSLQIFNVRSNLGSDDLDHLQLFAEYGRLAKKNADEEPFQELLFLVRDWCHASDYPLGIKGGNDFVDRRLSSDIEPFVQRRENIKACFTRVSGCLLPPPGETVAGSSKFAGDAEDIDVNFITTLEEMMSTLFSPGKLPVKMSGGRPMKCRQLASYIKACTELFQNEELPDAKSILQAISEAANMAAVHDGLQTYSKRMNGLLGEDAPMIDEKLLDEEHVKAKTDAVNFLEMHKTNGKRTIRDPTKPKNHYSCLLEENIEDWFRSQQIFKEKCKRDLSKAHEENERLVEKCLASFEKSMEVVDTDQPIDEERILEVYKEAKNVALKHFTDKKLTFGSYTGEEIQLNLEKALNEELSIVLKRNECDLANRAVVDDEFQIYKEQMLGLLVEEKQMLDKSRLHEEHDTKRADALKLLEQNMSTSDKTKPDNYYGCLLKDKIDTWFESSKPSFLEKCRRDRKRAQMANEQLIDDCISLFQESLGKAYTKHPDDVKYIQEKDREAQEAALQRFEAEVIEIDSYNVEGKWEELQAVLKKESSTWWDEYKQRRTATKLKQGLAITGLVACSIGGVLLSPALGIVSASKTVAGVTIGAVATGTGGAAFIGAAVKEVKDWWATRHSLWPNCSASKPSSKDKKTN